MHHLINIGHPVEREIVVLPLGVFGQLDRIAFHVIYNREMLPVRADDLHVRLNLIGIHVLSYHLLYLNVGRSHVVVA